MTITKVVPSLRLWELLADLAECGRESHSSLRELASRVAGLLRANLGAPVGIVRLVADDVHGTSEWGSERARRAATNGERQRLTEIALTYDGASGGAILIGWNDDAPDLDAGFLLALRRHVEALVAQTLRGAAQQQRARALFILFDNSAALTSGAQLSSLLERVAENTALLLDADICTIHLADDTRPGMFAEAAVYAPDHSVPGARYRLSEYPALSTLLDDEQPLVSSSTSRAALPLPLTRSLIVQPLRFRDVKLGFVAVLHVDRSHTPDRDDLTLLRTLGAQIATAVTNARLDQAERHHLSETELLGSFTERLSRQASSEEITATLLASAQALFPQSATEIALYQPEQTLLQIVQSVGLDPARAGSQQPLRTGLAGYVARHLRPLLLHEFRESPVAPLVAAFGDTTPIKSYLGVPLVAGDRLLGTIEVYGAYERLFDAHDTELLTVLAGQAAHALAATTAVGNEDDLLRRRLRQLRALQRISRELTATLYLHSILDFALHEALRATAAVSGAIALRGYAIQPLVADIQQDESIDGTSNKRQFSVARETGAQEVVRIVAVAGYDDQTAEALRNQPVAERLPHVLGVIDSGEAAIIEPQADDAQQPLLIVPVYYEAQVIGVLSLHAHPDQRFDRDSLDFSRAVADMAALAIGNEERFAEQRRQRDLLTQRAGMLREVLRIGQELHADRALDDVLDQIVFSVTETARYRAVVLYRVDDQTHTLHFLAGAGLTLDALELRRNRQITAPWLDELLNARFRLGRCFYVPGEIVRSVAADLSLADHTSGEDLREGDVWQPDDTLLAPIYSTGARLVGLLVVDEPFDRRRPERRDVEPIEIFADQAALAIENASLIKQAQSQAEQATALYQASRAASSSIDVDELLENVYREIVSYLGAPAFFSVVSCEPGRNQIFFELFRGVSGVLASHHKTWQPTTGLTSIVISTATPLVINDLDADAASLPVQPTVVPDTTAIRSWVGLPLIVNNTVFGVMALQSEHPGVFRDREVRFLSTLANQLAVALQNSVLFREREQRIRELDAINRIGQITSATLNLDTMFGQIYICLADYLPIESFFGYAYRSDSNELVAGLSFDEGQRVYEVRNEPPRPGGLLDWIINNRRPLRFGQLSQEAEAYGITLGSYGNVGRVTEACMVVPLLVGEGEVVGLLCVQSYTASVYTDRDLTFFTAVASQAALGVQNARLFEDRERQIVELDALSRIGRVTNSTLELRPMAEGLNLVLREVFSADSVGLTVLSRDRQRERLLVTHGERTVLDGRRTSSIEGEPDTLAGRVIRSGRGERIDSVSKTDAALLDIRALLDPDEQAKNLSGSCIAVPILAYDGVAIGALEVGSQHPAAFSEHDHAFLVTIGAQVSLGVQNARLYDEAHESSAALERKVGELSTLLQAAQTLSASLEPQEVLDRLMEGVRNQLLVSSVALWTISDDQLLVPAAMMGISEEIAATLRVPIGHGLTGRVAATGAPIVVLDVEREGGSLYPSFNRENNYTSFMGVPVSYQSQTIGVLSVMTNRLRAFTVDEVQLLTGMADQAALALQNARLFAEREQRIRLLTTINNLSHALGATLDTRELLLALYHGIDEVYSMGDSFIALYDDTTRMLSFPIFSDHGNLIETTGSTIDAGTDAPLAAAVIHSRTPLLLNTEDEIFRISPVRDPGERQISSWLGVPLVLGDRILGLLNVQSYEPYAFDDEAVRFVTTVANQAAQAIENARLFEQVRHAHSELEARVDARTAELANANILLQVEKENIQALHHTTLELTASLDLETTLNKALDLTAGAVGARRGSIMMRDQNSGELICRALLMSNGQVQTRTIPISFNQGASLAGWVMSQREPMFISDVRTDPRWLQVEGRADDVRSAIAAPLMMQDGPLGVILLTSQRVGAFNADQVQLLATIANAIAIVIHNATLYSVINDIAMERGELWAQQREETSKNQAILQSLGEGVVVLDEQEQIALVNQAAEHMLRLPMTTLLGRSFAALATIGDDDDARKRTATIYDAMRGGLSALDANSRYHSQLIELAAPNQWLSLGFAPWLGPRERRYGSVIVLRDITREVDSDQSKRRFISAVSHELRTPLTSIRGYTDLVLLGAAGTVSEEQRAYLTISKASAVKLEGLIGDLLEIGKIDENTVALSFAPVAIGEVFEETVRMLRTEITRKDMRLRTTLAPDLRTVEADGKRIGQVVSNLLSNAIKYTFPGGEIELAALVNRSGMLQVNVSDTGVGMSPDDLKKLFTRFYRANSPLKDEVGGTGLGLSIARSFVEMHGGEMWVESEQGKGSTFSFILPLTQPQRGGV